MRSIVRSINRTVIDPVYALTAKSDLEQFYPVTDSDEDVNILTTCFCHTFILSGSGCSGFTSIETDRSINRSVAVIAPYALTTKSDRELFSPVKTSDEDFSIFGGYYCT